MITGFTPAIYEHAAQLIGNSPWAVSRSKALLFSAHKRAFEIYAHSPIVVGIDIYNVEAEAYGAKLVDPGSASLPTPLSPVCATWHEALSLPPFFPLQAGRISMILECGCRLKQAFPQASVCIPVCGPFSVAAALLGMENLLVDVFMQPANVTALLQHLAVGQLRYCRAAINAGLGVALFESAAAPPLISPDQFRSVVSPAVGHVIKTLYDEFAFAVPFIIGGDTAAILPDIVSTGTGYVICPAETDQKAFLDIVQQYPHVTVRVNLRSNTVANGPISQLHAEVDGLISLTSALPNQVLLSPGVLPYEMEPERIHALRRYIQTQADIG